MRISSRYIAIILFTAMISSIVNIGAIFASGTDNIQHSQFQEQNLDEQVPLTMQLVASEIGVSEDNIQSMLDKGYTIGDVFRLLWNNRENMVGPGVQRPSQLNQLIEEEGGPVYAVNESSQAVSMIKSNIPEDFDFAVSNKFAEMPSELLLNNTTVTGVTYLLEAGTVTDNTYQPDEKSQSVGLMAVEPEIVKPEIAINEAPYKASLHSEDVSYLTGGLSVREADLTLPGRGGLSFALSRTYNSNSSQFYDTAVGYNYQYEYYVAFSYDINKRREYYELTRNYNRTVKSYKCSTGALYFTGSPENYPVSGGTYYNVNALTAAQQQQPGIASEQIHDCNWVNPSGGATGYKYYYEYTYISNSHVTKLEAAFSYAGSDVGSYGPYQLESDRDARYNSIVSNGWIGGGRGGDMASGFYEYEMRYSGYKEKVRDTISASPNNKLILDPLENKFPIGKG